MGEEVVGLNPSQSMGIWAEKVWDLVVQCETQWRAWECGVVDRRPRTRVCCGRGVQNGSWWGSMSKLFPPIFFLIYRFSYFPSPLFPLHLFLLFSLFHPHLSPPLLQPYHPPLPFITVTSLTWTSNLWVKQQGLYHKATQCHIKALLLLGLCLLKWQPPKNQIKIKKILICIIK